MPRIDRSVYSAAFSTFLAFAGPLVYAALARLIFGTQWPDWFGLLNLGFLFVVPFALGALTVFLASPKLRTSWAFALLGPLVPCGAFMVAAGLIAWEAWICIAMAAPIFLVMAMLGGTAMIIIFQALGMGGPASTWVLLLVLAAPYALTPLEHQAPNSETIRTVETAVVVKADPQTVWQDIIRLPHISEAEHPASFFHVLGLPRPVEADLTHEGLGGVRYGRWEDGLAFAGTITKWTPESGFTVQLEADTRQMHSRLPLQAIGGPNFGMVDDTYRIEPLAGGQVRLHLHSTYRVATHFNTYSVVWLDFLMRDIQSHILHIVKARAEAGA